VFGIHVVYMNWNIMDKLYVDEIDNFIISSVDNGGVWSLIYMPDTNVNCSLNGLQV
jgi:hypothetical protein